MGVLSRSKARKTYNRIGAIQDTQGFYEDPATGLLIEHGDFSSAQTVFEFGCGTGRFARRLLDEELTETAKYRGVDVSPKMVALTRKRSTGELQECFVADLDGLVVGTVTLTTRTTWGPDWKTPDRTVRVGLPIAPGPSRYSR